MFASGLFTTIKLVIRTLLARKLRSFLTMLGIVIGVAGVIVIIALGAGAQSLVLSQVTKLGSNLLSVQPGKSNEKGPPAQVFGVTITTLVNGDAQALRNNPSVPHIVAVDPLALGSATVDWQNQSVDTNFIGTDASYAQVFDFSLQSGRFFSDQEGMGSSNVVVLGSAVADELFSNAGIDPVGQVIKVRSASQTEAGGIPLRVVGVIAPRGNSFFEDWDDEMFLPLSIGQHQLLGISYLRMIDIKVDSADAVNQTRDQIIQVLNQRHHVQTPEQRDFTVRSIADAISILSTVTDALRLFLAAMAGIALVVGGIGILNIMLAAVAERTREIGLRKALGATQGAIARQFLLESGLLTLMGGLAGILAGILLSWLMALLMRRLGYQWDFVIAWWSVILAVGVSVLTGVIFGLYPALKASKLNPIEALRYE